MKILIESYNNVKQNLSGGIQVRIEKLIKKLQINDINVKRFNKWEDKISDYDILHIFKVSMEHYDMVMYAKRVGVPIVISSIVPLEKKILIQINLLICKIIPIHTAYWFMEQMLKMANAVIAQTEKEAKFISRLYRIDRNKIHVIPNGANTNIKNGDPSIMVNKTGINKPYILQVGRFDRNKNQLNIIKAMRGSNIPIVFIGGSDPSDPEYFEICKKEATENIHFLGWVKNDDPLLASAYSNAQVVVLPSFKEIFGNSLIEGGAAGANLVATDELPIKDWGLDSYCQTITPKNINNIRKVLEKAYNTNKDPKISNLICNKFSWDNVTLQHISIYKAIINNT